jgi:glycosyltransferase involved in cell wall biosynthesis
MFFTTKPSVNYYATCHWFYMLPEFTTGFKGNAIALLERMSLRFVLYRGWRIISHSKAGSNILLGNDNYVLDYPLVPMQSICSDKITDFRNSLGLKPESVLLLCFGGTRFDKGADLAVEALAKLDDSYHLIIAGKEECIAFETLKEIAQANNCTHRLHLINGFVSDKDTELLFNACDIVFIPYRKTFSGQSGPLTIGASLGKFIVSSNAMILEETVRRFNLGRTFEVENVPQSVKEIQKFTNIRSNCAPKLFNKIHSTSTFIENHKEIYATK